MNVSWTKESKFWKTGRNKIAKLKFVSAQKPKKMKKAVEFSAIWFLLEVFPGQEKCSFQNSSGKNSPNLSLFPKFGNDRKIYNFFEKILSSNCPSRHRECTFDTPPSKFFSECKSFFCSKPTGINNIVHFSAKSFFFKVFAGHEKWKNDKLCWIAFAKLRSLFQLKAPEVGQKCTLFTKIIFPRFVCWTGEK